LRGQEVVGLGAEGPLSALRERDAGERGTTRGEGRTSPEAVAAQSAGRGSNYFKSNRTRGVFKAQKLKGGG